MDYMCNFKNGVFMKKMFDKENLAGLIVLIFITLSFGIWNCSKAKAPIDIGHPQKGDFVKVGEMSVPRWGHETILLDDGNVLLFGGCEKNQQVIDAYDFKTKKFKKIKEMNGLHGEFTATKLKNGAVLIVGWSGGKTARRAELFDPKTSTFKYTGELNYFRSLHTATLLNDGRVLITGGDYSVYNPMKKTIPDEIFNPVTGKFTTIPPLKIPREKHSAILLNDGRVLILGGGNKTGKLSSAEIYNPKTNKFKLEGNMNSPKVMPILYLLKNGNVLITNAFDKEIEIYNPKINKFKIIAKRISEPKMPAEVLLNDDTLLFTGGHTGVGLSLWWYKTSEIFVPQTGKFTQGKDMNFLRSGHRMTLLKDGNVLISGSEGKGRTAELYIYDNKK